MTNYHYHWSLLTVLILLIQTTNLAIARQTKYESILASNVSPNNNLRPTIITTPISTVSTNNEEIDYDGDNENSGAEIYDDDADDVEQNSLTTTMAQSQSNNHNMTSNLNENTPVNDYDDEISSYQDNPDGGDHIYGDTMSIDRPESKRPIIDSNISQSTSRMPFVPSNLWRNLFSKPAILVGIIGGIVIGMLSAILLVMFIIYRMRKKDEGSYALEEGPRKSPSHAYTRVSSREFFA